MVLWLTHIMGWPQNSIRNRAEICTGDHHWAGQLLTRSASGRCASFGVLGRLACSRGALVGPPRPVVGSAAVGGDLPRHRGDRLPSRAVIAAKGPACTPR